MFKLNPEYKSQLVDALLECPSVSDRDIRNTLVNDLPENIKDMIHRHPANRIDVVNIVNRCLDFYDGLEGLTNRLRGFEGESKPMKKVYRIIPFVLGFDSIILNEQLSELLALFSRIAFEPKNLGDAYRECLPPGRKAYKEPQTLWGIVWHLAKIPFHQPTRTLPILLFTRIIEQMVDSDEIIEQLDGWSSRIVSTLEPDLGKIELEPKVSYAESKSGPIYLLVHLIPDPNNQNHRVQEFTMNVYAWRNPETSPCIHRIRACQREKILEKLDCLMESFDEDDEIRAIEFILPYESIDLKVDEWKRTEEFEWETKLGQYHRVVVRLDRYRHPRRFRDKWKEQWKLFQERLRNGSVDDCIQWECDHKLHDFKQTAGEFFDDKKPKVCLMMTFLPDKPADLGRAILTAGIPVALWCGKSGHSDEDHKTIKNEIRGLIENGNIGKLPDLLHKRCRKPEYEKESGHRFTLLWDNPERVPLELKKCPLFKTP